MSPICTDHVQITTQMADCCCYKDRCAMRQSSKGSYLRGVRVSLWAFWPGHGPFAETIWWPFKGNDPAALQPSPL